MPRLEIINDTEFNAAHSVMSDDLIYREMNDVAEVYVLPQEGSDVRILKKDIWRTKNATGTHFKVLRFTFRNLTIAENLPFSVDFHTLVISDMKLFLSKIFKSDLNSIALWKKACLIQSVLLFVLIIAAGGLLSFLFFDGYYGAICFAAMFVFDILIFASIAKEHKKCRKFLEKYCS